MKNASMIRLEKSAERYAEKLGAGGYEIATAVVYAFAAGVEAEKKRQSTEQEKKQEK